MAMFFDFPVRADNTPIACAWHPTASLLAVAAREVCGLCAVCDFGRAPSEGDVECFFFFCFLLVSNASFFELRFEELGLLGHHIFSPHD
jgi:hypothetical protein